MYCDRMKECAVTRPAGRSCVKYFCLFALMLLSLPACRKSGPEGPSQPEDTYVKPELDKPLTPWVEGYLDIHCINGGRGESYYIIMPDGTTMLVDAAGATDSERQAEGNSYLPSRPSMYFTSGNVIVSYVKHFAPAVSNGRIDYLMLSHYHSDHQGSFTTAFADYNWGCMDSSGSPVPTLDLNAGGFILNGLTEVGASIPVGKVIDRGDWDARASNTYNTTNNHSRYKNYLNFLDWSARQNGTVREKIRVGHTDQVVLKKKPSAYPDFSIRAIAGNGDVWTGKGVEVNTDYMPPASEFLANVKTWDVNENILSCVFTMSYGKFDYFSGGDIQYNDYTEFSWKDIEKPIAKVVKPVEVMKACHHATSNTNSSALISALSPDVLLVGVWTRNQPNASTMGRFYKAVPSLRVFTTNMDDSARDKLEAAGILTKVFGATSGHIVVRVSPGGGEYYVYALDDGDFHYNVKAIRGPYECK